MNHMVLKHMSQKSYPDAVLQAFIDYVAGPSVGYFTKIKFFNAVNHLIVILNPALAANFAEPMPGMANFTGSNKAVSQTQ